MYKLVPDKHNENVPDSCCETFKSFLLHLVFEFIGTMLMAFSFICAPFGSIEQVGGFAVALMVSASVSGGYCNPAITLGCMMRRDNKKISVKLGLCYIGIQYLAGVAAATLALLIQKNAAIGYLVADHYYTALISVTIGSFIIVFMFMTQTAKITSFTEDIAISMFIIAGSYEAGALIVNQSVLGYGNASGNPAIDGGLFFTMIFKSGGKAFANSWLFIIVPFGGAVLAVIFNELLYKKSIIQAEEIDEEIKEEEEERNFDYDNTYQQEA